MEYTFVFITFIFHAQICLKLINLYLIVYPFNIYISDLVFPPFQIYLIIYMLGHFMSILSVKA